MTQGTHTDQLKKIQSDQRAHSTPVIWVGYTFHYRTGGIQLRRVAETMVHEKRRDHPEARVVLHELNSKREFIDSLLVIEPGALRELQFIGHSGMYGPMFGTTSFPEQLSPHEWRSLDLPFAPDGEAYFHACRTGRWFADFFARTFGVPAHGYHWYTTFSRDPITFKWAGREPAPDTQTTSSEPLYMRGCPGRKSHGVWAGLQKYLGQVELERPIRFEPPSQDTASADTSYDPVADLYADVFEDIRVRRDEWRWLKRHIEPLERGLSVLDIGCGNGALLRALSEDLPDHIARGHGVDASRAMIERASAEQAHLSHLTFDTIDGPDLPFEDNQFDVVISFLSFRYLDWDPLMREVIRTLKPGGHLIIIDMVTAPLKLKELPMFARSKLTYRRVKKEHPVFHQRLTKLVKRPEWRQMLHYNPIRAQHEMVWYLESRFEGRRVEMINAGLANRVLAFDSGPIEIDHVAPQSYP